MRWLASVHWFLVAHVITMIRQDGAGGEGARARVEGDKPTWMEPLAATSSFLRSGDHRPRRVRSISRCWFTTVNSPLSTRRTYMLRVYGSKHSLLPSICKANSKGLGRLLLGVGKQGVGVKMLDAYGSFMTTPNFVFAISTFPAS